MESLRGRVALVTGATGGLGPVIARALAREGMDLVVTGRRVDALDATAAALRATGARADSVPADLADLDATGALLERAERSFGPIDVLVNNAGVENVAAFTALTPEELTAMVDVNLSAPMLLTRHVLPGMLARGRGHVVFISSTAGKYGPAFSEPYAATKAALIGLTQSLRAEYGRSPVGFSVVCPGFIGGDGMYQRMVERGFRSNRVIGETTTSKVADKVVTAIRRDLPEVIESGAPIRPLLAFAALAPRLAERIAGKVGVNEMFRRLSEERGRTG
ncbi:SDR family NAD(P)-dependent oxidoreductase [Rhodococcus oryzae]|uniref:SDR family NAD(P)-dependent oxidoreductase n=1 Tax=Rhodococcus oryzae TaxID=2571143 RepID=A0ABY2RN00_9NOCA|nr:SDR family NAD(P)-dependent oxidoreductase [Rhodococcus oryzae]TJZ79669.1 SDR family NAD(P)-dependent oxidoreductase [Rhodococcus oryzae]